MRTLTKFDLKKELKGLYSAPQHPVLVEVPSLSYLMVDGSGAPASGAYQEAIQALYSVAYPLKFWLKRNQGADIVVMPLETLWWSAEGNPLTLDEHAAWRWTAMILEPDLVTADLVARIIAEESDKKSLPALSKVRLEELFEGRAVQMMHVGPYAEEASTVEAMHEFIDGQGLRPTGRHHEIYLSDPRRTAPRRIRTIIRQPVVS